MGQFPCFVLVVFPNMAVRGRRRRRWRWREGGRKRRDNK